MGSFDRVRSAPAQPPVVRTVRRNSIYQTLSGAERLCVPCCGRCGARPQIGHLIGAKFRSLSQLCFCSTTPRSPDKTPCRPRRRRDRHHKAGPRPPRLFGGAGSAVDQHDLLDRAPDALDARKQFHAHLLTFAKKWAPRRVSIRFQHKMGEGHPTAIALRHL